MSGPLVMWAAADFPERIACIASIHGANMATEKPDSPHRMAPKIRCESYFACAEIDKWAPPADIDKLAAALRDAGTPHRIEWYPGVEHGFVFPAAWAPTTAPPRSATGNACSPSSTAPCGERGLDDRGAPRSMLKSARSTFQEDAMTRLRPAAELAAAASKPYPNDSDEYRRARTALLAEEIELRRHIERVAAQRRALPLGGEARDYSFKDETGKTVKLADLFGGTTRSSPTSGCSARSASARARCARRSSARSTSRRRTSRSASRSPRSAARRSSASSRSRASAAGRT
jgi:hypothetical protein